MISSRTVVLHLAAYSNQMPWAFGWVPMLSKVAYETKGKEWCRADVVAPVLKTGGMEEGRLLKWGKIDGYWQKGRIA